MILRGRVRDRKKEEGCFVYICCVYLRRAVFCAWGQRVLCWLGVVDIVHIGDDFYRILSFTKVLYVHVRSIGLILMFLSFSSAQNHDTVNKHNPAQLPLALTRELRRELPQDPTRLSAPRANVASAGSD
jgi:hypothetical protein